MELDHMLCFDERGSSAGFVVEVEKEAMDEAD